MLIIIAHHYVVNSGITSLYDFSNITANMVFLQCLGFGGKMAINIFVLISGYFMCTQAVTWKRVLKLVLLVYFYRFIIFSIFIYFGYESISLRSVFNLLFSIPYSIGREFVGSFIAFYLLVPFLNKWLQSLTRKDHLNLMILMVILFSFVYTFLFATDSCRYVLWFIVLYFIASYIRLYPNRITESRNIALWCSVFFLLLTWCSIVVVDFLGSKIGFTNFYFLCIDCPKVLALALSLSLFLFFKNIHINQSKLINTFAASTFGVLLIHANSAAMRTWLWQDFLKVPSQYELNFLPLHFFLSIIGIYLICIGIDYLRILFIEKPVFEKLDKCSFLQKKCFID